MSAADGPGYYWYRNQDNTIKILFSTRDYEWSKSDFPHKCVAEEIYSTLPGPFNAQIMTKSTVFWKWGMRVSQREVIKILLSEF